MNNRKDMPKSEDVAKYWHPILSRMGLEYDDYILYAKQCFVCTSTSQRIERAHIKALCDGGTNDLKNIHLLCASCHSESEFLSGKKYWLWYRYQRAHKPSYLLNSMLASVGAIK